MGACSLTEQDLELLKRFFKNKESQGSMRNVRMYTEQQLKTNLVEGRYIILLQDSLRGERSRLYGHLYSDLLNAMKYYQSVKEDVLKDLKRKAKGKEASHNKTSSLYAEYETRLKTGWIRVVKDLSEDLDYISDSFEDVYSNFVKRNKLKQII